MELKIWKTIKLGTGIKSGADFRSALQNVGCQIGNNATLTLDFIFDLPGCEIAQEEIEIDLVLICPQDAGFKKRVSFKRWYKWVKQSGLKFCPPEVAPQLRLQYMDQPMDEWINVGMGPIQYEDGRLSVLHIGRSPRDYGGIFYLSQGFTENADKAFWTPDGLWVFIRPRKYFIRAPSNQRGSSYAKLGIKNLSPLSVWRRLRASGFLRRSCGYLDWGQSRPSGIVGFKRTLGHDARIRFLLESAQGGREI